MGMKKSVKNKFLIVGLFLAVVLIASISVFSLTGNVVTSFPEPVKIMNVSNDGNSVCVNVVIPRKYINVRGDANSYTKNIFREETGIFGVTETEQGFDHDTDTTLYTSKQFVEFSDLNLVFQDLGRFKSQYVSQEECWNAANFFSGDANPLTGLGYFHFGLTILDQRNKVLGYGAIEIMCNEETSKCYGNNVGWGEFRLSSNLNTNETITPEA